MNSRLILTSILIGFAILFIIQNVDIVSVHFFSWTLSMSGALLFLLFLALGVVLGWLLHSYSIHRKKAQKRL